MQTLNEQSDPDLFSAVYSDLRRIASCHMRSENKGRSLQATALVHETYLKLARNLDPAKWPDRQYFLAAASRAMRRILVDRARARQAQKRDSAGQLPFHGFANTHEFLNLHDALERLAKIDSRQARVVEMRFFGGLTEEEIADVLGVASRTVKRDWQLAKAWLYGELAA
jgi:RNA polymerase sigma factor (TIGR02999 family)